MWKGHFIFQRILISVVLPHRASWKAVGVRAAPQCTFLAGTGQGSARLRWHVWSREELHGSETSASFLVVFHLRCFSVFKWKEFVQWLIVNWGAPRTILQFASVKPDEHLWTQKWGIKWLGEEVLYAVSWTGAGGHFLKATFSFCLR